MSEIDELKAFLKSENVAMRIRTSQLLTSLTADKEGKKLIESDSSFIEVSGFSNGISSQI